MHAEEFYYKRCHANAVNIVFMFDLIYRIYNSDLCE